MYLLTYINSSHITLFLEEVAIIVITTGCTKYVQYVILLRGITPGHDRNWFIQSVKINQTFISGSCLTATSNQMYNHLVSHFCKRNRWQKKTIKQTFLTEVRKTIVCTLKILLKSAINLVCMYSSTMQLELWSPLSENIESRQLHLHSTCVLNGAERCGVIQAPNFRDGGST